ncbi:uncharacterized protein MKK02DRAFT_43370 [Dioszegia hungarica]|uniref:FIST domain-containing protein n=1 Tax=Dioszegia hungarica TaxID=4972 RepID=A0AA38HEK3_9TREE|nr:uncharacterized protein MKK02DRAFT_43370 [Dioszegia hungarica]KAI9637449.1 hypothetical protein MKK02DRAFT_43370 [Dioszegia hungarica]
MGLIRAIQLAQRAPSRSLANRAYSTSSARPFIITSTLFSPTPDFLASHLASNPAPTDSLTLYTICTTLPSLPGLLPHLQRLPNSIGSFSHPRPVQAGQNQPYISLAHFPRNGGSVFHTALTGRRPVEVGRWHRPHPDGVGKEDLKGGEMGDLGDVRGAGLGGWGEAWEADAGAADERVQGLEGVDAQTILLLTDASPRPVLRALDAQFPHAVKAGLLTAPTPFITGRPHTLLLNDKIHNTGAVGLALPYKLDVGVEFGLEPMGEPMVVDRSQGNMLLSLVSHPNPAQILISAIQKRGGAGLISKEEDFYLALLNPASEGGGIREAVKIMGGDPGKGALSLEMEDSLVQGQAVQFMQKSSLPTSLPLSPSRLSFGALARSDDPDSEDSDAAQRKPRVEEGFMGLSEAGFLYSVRGRSAMGTAGGGFAVLR